MQPIAKLSDLKEGQALKFTVLRSKSRLHGFLVHVQGNLVAYENRCRHHPLSLDGGTGVFMAPEQKAIRCVHHGALFDPATGRCLRGPCWGDHLRPIPFLVKEDLIFILPEECPG